jgi:hypothetical protein
MQQQEKKKKALQCCSVAQQEKKTRRYCATPRRRRRRATAVAFFMELRCNAAPSSLWSCLAARLRAVPGAALQCNSELFVELRSNVAMSSAQL